MLKARISAIFLIVILLFLSVPAMAWDENGHKITAYIAWQRMTPEVRDRVIKTLLAAPEDSDLATFFAGYGSRSPDSRRREYFMTIATWPDIIRDKNFNTRYTKYHHGDWHYADTLWKYEKGKSVLVEQQGDGLAITKLHEFDSLIRGTASDAEKAVAIAWLEHLVGDIHQPLHASGKVTDTNAKGDQGGNLFLLTPKGTPRDKQENLHWFWDSIVVRYSPNLKDQCDADFLDPIAQEMMSKYPYDKMKDRLQPRNFEAWAKESLDISMTEVYKDVKWFEMPSDKYKKKAFEIAQERMALAGYRMGDLFNQAFGTAPVPVAVK